MNLTNQIIVITGGAKGLGKELARILVTKGARVIICDRDEVELKQTADELGLTGLVMDVIDELAVTETVKQIVADFGRIDVWINNAGVWLPPVQIEDVDLVKAKKLFDINVFGTINGVRAVVRSMKARASGTIVNIVSTTAFDGMSGSSGSMYVASKYALRGLTNVWREELKSSQIRMIGVYPGGIKTDIFNEAKPANLDQFMSAEDVAGKIVANLESQEPEVQLVIKRLGQELSRELI